MLGGGLDGGDPPLENNTKQNKVKTMKHKYISLGLAGLVLAMTTFSLSAQTTNGTAGTPGTNVTQVPNLLPPLPTISGGLTQIYEAINTSGLTTATNYAIEPYLTYAPSAPSGNQIGGGIFAAYNVSKLIGTGLAVDYLGQFSLVSAQVQLKVPMHPFAFLGSAWATNLVVAPFALAGVGTPLSGGNGAIAVTDAGAYVQFGHLWGGQFNTGAAVGKWANAGDYSGTRYHFFAGWSKGF